MNPRSIASSAPARPPILVNGDIGDAAHDDWVISATAVVPVAHTTGTMMIPAVAAAVVIADAVVMPVVHATAVMRIAAATVVLVTHATAAIMIAAIAAAVVITGDTSAAFCPG